VIQFSFDLVPHTQLMSDSVTVNPRARTSDPETSHEAAASARELAVKHQALILECLKKHGPLGKDGIAARTRLDGVQTCRRLTELERAGLIQWTGECVLSTAGRKEREWRAA
jgi:predicted transcriptional regulator